MNSLAKPANKTQFPQSFKNWKVSTSSPPEWNSKSPLSFFHDSKFEMNNNPVIQKIGKILKDLEHSEIWKKKDTPSEAFEPSHFEAAICRTSRYQKFDETMTWKSIYHNHSTVTLSSLQSPQTPPRVTKSVKSLIQTLSSSPLMDAPISFLPLRQSFLVKGRIIIYK